MGLDVSPSLNGQSSNTEAMNQTGLCESRLTPSCTCCGRGGGAGVFFVGGRAQLAWTQLSMKAGHRGPHLLRGARPPGVLSPSPIACFGYRSQMENRRPDAPRSASIWASALLIVQPRNDVSRQAVRCRGGTSPWRRHVRLTAQ